MTECLLLVALSSVWACDGASRTADSANAQKGAGISTPAASPSPNGRGRTTPSIATSPENISDADRTKYLKKLAFDGSNGDEVICPSESCDQGDPRAEVKIEPEVGSHLLTRDNFEKDGWHVVARITLVGDLSNGHRKYQLEKQHRIAYWWVGLKNGKLRSLLVGATSTSPAIDVPFCLRTNTDIEHPESPSASWTNDHGSGTCDNPTGPAVSALSTQEKQRILSFHETWFACDVGCCGSLEGR